MFFFFLILLAALIIKTFGTVRCGTCLVVVFVALTFVQAYAHMRRRMAMTFGLSLIQVCRPAGLETVLVQTSSSQRRLKGAVESPPGGQQRNCNPSVTFRRKSHRKVQLIVRCSWNIAGRPVSSTLWNPVKRLCRRFNGRAGGRSCTRTWELSLD